jgi:methyl-accepting chemotaxis protein
LNRVFTVTADNYLTDEEALAKYNAELEIASQEQEKLTRLHNAAADSTEYNDKAAAGLYETYVELNDLLGDTGSTFNDLGESAGDVAEQFGNIGKKAEKGAKEANEGLGKMNDGLSEALPLAKELRDVLREIVTLGSQADI